MLARLRVRLGLFDVGALADAEDGEDDGDELEIYQEKGGAVEDALEGAVTIQLALGTVPLISEANAGIPFRGFTASVVICV